MGTGPHTTNQQASQAPLTEADRLAIALALQTPVEHDVQTAQYQELSEKALLQRADALLLRIQDRTIFLDTEILGKDGFIQAVRRQYAIAYRGIRAAHQLLEMLLEREAQSVKTNRFQDDFLEQLRDDFHTTRLAARKGMLGMLLSITENLVSCAPANDATQFEALEEAIDNYQYRYPLLSAAMQQHLQHWLRANPGN